MKSEICCQKLIESDKRYIVKSITYLISLKRWIDLEKVCLFFDSMTRIKSPQSDLAVSP